MPGVEKRRYIDVEGDALLLKAENTSRKYKKEVALLLAVDPASLHPPTKTASWKSRCRK